MRGTGPDIGGKNASGKSRGGVLSENASECS